MEQIKRAGRPYLEIGEQAFAFAGDCLEFVATPRGGRHIVGDAFVVDVYAQDDHTHPHGHLGWWEYPLQDTAPLHVRMTRAPGGMDVTVNGAPAPIFWRNDAFRQEGRPLAMHLLLRAWRSKTVLFDDPVPVFPDAAALHAARDGAGAPSVPDYVPARWFVWPEGRRVLLMAESLRSAGVRTFCNEASALLRANGIPCRVFAHEYRSAERVRLFPAAYVCHEARRDDILIYVLADSCDELPTVAGLECRKLLYCLGLPDWKRYQAFDAAFARKLEATRGNLGLLARFDGLCFESGYTQRTIMAALRKLMQKRLLDPAAAGERSDDGASRPEPAPPPVRPAFRVRTVVCARRGQISEAGEAPARIIPLHIVEPVLPPVLGVFPPALWPRDWDRVTEEPCVAPPRFILSVGSFRPDRRYEDALAIFAAVAERDPEMGLVIAGWPAVNGYWDYIRFLREHTYARLANRIVLLQSASEGQLRFLYRTSRLFLSTCQHEGYSGSLLAALQFGLPVMARTTPAVRHILGRSGLQYHEGDAPDTIAADLLRLSARDAPRANTIMERQHRHTHEAAENFLAAIFHGLSEDTP